MPRGRVRIYTPEEAEDRAKARNRVCAQRLRDVKKMDGDSCEIEPSQEVITGVEVSLPENLDTSKNRVALLKFYIERMTQNVSVSLFTRAKHVAQLIRLIEDIEQREKQIHEARKLRAKMDAV